MKCKEIEKELIKCLNNENIKHIYKIKLPGQIKGAVLFDKKQKHYSILLNINTRKSNISTLLHELLHIYFKDVVNPLPASQIEYIRHKQTRIMRKNLSYQTKNIFKSIIAKAEIYEI